MTHRRPLAAVTALLTLLVTVLVAGQPVDAGAATDPTYTNPVSKDFADTFADPSLIRGKDGFWYSYGTSDPLREGEGTPHRVPIARSADLVHWQHVGDVFTDATLPTWAEPDAGIWAPDIRYVNGQYRLYYVVTETTVTPERGDNAIGMATAPSPTGPWTASGAPVVGPRCVGPGNCKWTFDPSAVTDTDGSQHLFYGSYYGGIFEAPLSRDGSRTVGDPTMVAIDNKFEGAYVIRRAGWWYLFASTANCCAGPTTGYSVQVGRSRSLDGPYLDREGTSLTASRAGGTPTLMQNGNTWVGPGHNAVVTDMAGQDWLVYHAIDRADPYLDGTDGINQRPMLLDRLDWVDGWPAVRAGRGPSDDPQTAPITGPVSTFDDGIGPQWRQVGHWTTETEADAGGYATSHRGKSALITDVPTPGHVRVEADLRGKAALLVGPPHKRPWVTARIDTKQGVLLVQAMGRHGRPSTSRAPLPRGYDPTVWHSASLQLRDGRAYAELSHARLGDPLAVVDMALPAGAGMSDSAGARSWGGGVDVDNLSVLTPTEPVTALAPDDVPSTLDPSGSDEFDGDSLGAGWTWVREDPQAEVTDGVLRWPTEAADLVGADNQAGVLLRPAPQGDWAIVTKLSIDLGTDTVRNYQQAGLVVYANDDLFTRLCHVAIWNTRQTEFGKEMPYAGRLSYGGTIIGPPAETTYLRITHHIDPANGEHELRGWSSRDGQTWVKGGVWTLPADAQLRVGLVSQGRGASDPAATAQFDWFRTYR